jgi:hypothetical protein
MTPEARETSVPASRDNAMQYAVKRGGWTQAQFIYAKDAEEYVKRKIAPQHYEIIEIKSDRRVVRTTAHGHAILDKLEAGRGERP